jgi:hypothetical protein
MSTTGMAGYTAQWKAAAQQAGQQLGIPWQWVLSQWGVEYGFSNGPQQGQNNPADLRALPGQSATAGGWANFPSVSSFVAEYVKTVKSDFGYFNAPVANPTPAQVFGSQSNYTTSQSAASYTQAVLNSLHALAASGAAGPGVPVLTATSTLPATGTSVNTGQGVLDNGQPSVASLSAVQDLTTGAKTAAASAGRGVTGLIAGIEAWAGHGLAVAGTVALGVVMAAVGLWLLVASERTQIERAAAAALPEVAE